MILGPNHFVSVWQNVEARRQECRRNLQPAAATHTIGHSAVSDIDLMKCLNRKWIHVAGCSTGRQLYNSIGQYVSDHLHAKFVGKIAKMRGCYAIFQECKSAGGSSDKCNVELCACRMRQPSDFGSVSVGNFSLKLSFKWKEHALDTDDSTFFEVNGKLPDVVFSNSGIHAFHGLTNVFPWIPMDYTKSKLHEAYYHNSSTLFRDMMQKKQCFIW
eukprot:CAMPEP_0182859368 /NCGR_PEP_ID=MMETSP0034_2-20130328/4250_1 /TAXON_ID=156128 /ORGANISM="Nephroselmis pyriformis, Strain CCMP717" /LENGTH=214 /DNA_ID=CAMNT_0024990963 /DNA_START=275 /DNA_END=916 /DNA_ORIENTATION=+